LQGKSYLSAVMDEALPMQPEGWMILTRRLTAFFFALAIANEAVWRLMSTEAWVNFKTFGLTAALFLFILTQGPPVRALFDRAQGLSRPTWVFAAPAAPSCHTLAGFRAHPGSQLLEGHLPHAAPDD
jgi:hypothetical protein